MTGSKIYALSLAFFISNLFTVYNAFSSNILSQPTYQSGECTAQATTYGTTTTVLSDPGGEAALAVIIPYYPDHGYEISNRNMYLRNYQRGSTYTDKHIISSGEKPLNCDNIEVLDNSTFNNLTNDQLIKESKLPRQFDSDGNQVLDSNNDPIYSGSYLPTGTEVLEEDKTELDMINPDGTILTDNELPSSNTKSAEDWIKVIEVNKREKQE